MITCSDRIALRLGCSLLLALACLSAACDSGGSKASPTITAQGFDLQHTPDVQLGEASQLRLRIEAPSGIEKLLIRERSYEVDLAQSPETTHFPLFGLPRRVWSKTDVTLDFGPYVAEKLQEPGEYAFSIVVSDRNQQTLEETLRVLVLPETTETDSNSEPSPPQTQPLEPVESGAATETLLRTTPFQLERVGPGPVLDGEELRRESLHASRGGCLHKYRHARETRPDPGLSRVSTKHGPHHRRRCCSGIGIRDRAARPELPASSRSQRDDPLRTRHHRHPDGALQKLSDYPLKASDSRSAQRFSYHC